MMRAISNYVLPRLFAGDMAPEPELVALKAAHYSKALALYGL